MSIYTEILWYQVNLQRFFIDAPSVSMYRDFMVPRVGQFMQIVWGPESTLFLGSLIDPGNEVGPEYILSCPEYVNSVTEILWCSEYVANVQRFYGAHNRSNYRGFAEILWCLECVNSQRFYDALFSMISIGLKRQLDEPRPSKSAFLAISLSPSPSVAWQREFVHWTVSRFHSSLGNLLRAVFLPSHSCTQTR